MPVKMAGTAMEGAASEVAEGAFDGSAVEEVSGDCGGIVRQYIPAAGPRLKALARKFAEALCDGARYEGDSSIALKWQLTRLFERVDYREPAFWFANLPWVLPEELMDLTPEQKELVPQYIEKWTKIGLCTDPADRPRAEEAIRMLYTAAGYAPPSAIVWCGDFLMEEAWEAQKKAGIATHTASDCMYGQHEAYWLCYYDFLSEVLGDKQYDEKLAGLMQLAQSGGWILPYDTVCFVGERHSAVSLDEQYRLHADFGPALAYPSGWESYVVHGVEVPKAVVMSPALLTPAEVMAEQNAEVRRVMMDRYGWSREQASLDEWLRDRTGWKKFTLDANPTKVHEDDYGVLMRLEIEGEPEPIMMVKVVNGTAEADGSYKDYMLQVPPAMQTAREAVAWTYEKDAADYKPTLRT